MNYKSVNFEESSSTSTQSLFKPEVGGVKFTIPILGHSPAGIVAPSRGLNHVALTLSALIFFITIFTGWPTAR